MNSVKIRATNAADSGMIQSAGLSVVKSKIFWKKGMYITPSVNRKVASTPTMSSLFVKIPIL